MNVKDIRRHNLRELSGQLGTVTALSQLLKKSQAQISHLIGKNPSKNIGDKLAKQIEEAFSKPHGWLDQIHADINRVEEVQFAVKSAKNKPLYWLPLIDWDQVSIYVAGNKQAVAIACESFPTMVKLSKKSFAVRIKDSGLNKDKQLKLPEDSVVIIDRKAIVNDGALVITAKPNDNEVSLKYYYSDAFPNPNNTSQNMFALATEHDLTHVVGVIKQVIVSF